MNSSSKKWQTKDKDRFFRFRAERSTLTLHEPPKLPRDASKEWDIIFSNSWHNLRVRHYFHSCKIMTWGKILEFLISFSFIFWIFVYCMRLIDRARNVNSTKRVHYFCCGCRCVRRGLLLLLLFGFGRRRFGWKGKSVIALRLRPSCRVKDLEEKVMGHGWWQSFNVNVSSISSSRQQWIAITILISQLSFNNQRNYNVSDTSLHSHTIPMLGRRR